MIIEKNTEGAWLISDIVGGYRISQRYYFYTKREAVRLFREYVRGL